MVRCQEMSQRSPTTTLVDARAVTARYPGTRARRAVDEGAAAIGDRMRDSVGVHRFRGKVDEIVALTVSAGCATLTEDVLSARDLIARADAALYEAKRSGKNKVCRAG